MSEIRADSNTSPKERRYALAMAQALHQRANPWNINPPGWRRRRRGSIMAATVGSDRQLAEGAGDSGAAFGNRRWLKLGIGAYRSDHTPGCDDGLDSPDPCLAHDPKQTGSAADGEGHRPPLGLRPSPLLHAIPILYPILLAITIGYHIWYDLSQTIFASRPPADASPESVRCEPPLPLSARLSPVAWNHGRQLRERTPG